MVLGGAVGFWGLLGLEAAWFGSGGVRGSRWFRSLAAWEDGGWVPVVQSAESRCAAAVEGCAVTATA